MKAQTRFAFIGLLVLIALVASIALPITALADGAPTPPPSSDSSGSAQPAQGADTSAPAQPAQPADTSAPAQPADTLAPTEPPPAVDTSAPATDAPAATQDPATAVASDTPAPADTSTDTNSPSATDTPIVVINSTGTVEPLATQEAADIIETGDPIWCPNTSSPVANSGGCSKSYGNLYSLVNAITTGKLAEPNKNGTIWITASSIAGTDSSAHNIDIDGSIFTTWAQHTLTLNGGWDGSSAGTIIGTSDFIKYISITNWTDDVTIKDINISGTNSDGLTVTTAGDIKVKDVTSTNNKGNGASLDNSKGAGNITIKGSYNNFSDNQNNGLEVYSKGYVTLNNVIADGNKYDGALLGGDYYSDYPAIGGDISVTGSDFSFNNGHGGSNNPAGLEAYAYGTITLKDVTANENNNGDGAYLDNCLYDETRCNGTGSIDVDKSTFGDAPSTGNEHNGLEVYSNENVTLNKVTADGNKFDGAILGDPYVAIGGDISVTGNSEFNHNKGKQEGGNQAGLEAYAYGYITLTGVNANHNSRAGASLESFDTDQSGIDVSSSNLNNNGTCGYECETSLDGLDAFSSGNITLADVNANFNTYGAGVVAGSSGKITLNNIAADHNTDGAILLAGILVNPAIEINNSHFNYNSQYGLGVMALGNVTLNNTDAIGNGLDGADVGAFGAVIVSCGHYNDNGDTGINDTGSTSLYLNNPELSGNGNAPYAYAGTAIIGIDCSGTLAPSGSSDLSTGKSHAASINIIPITGLPIHTVNVTGGEGTGLDCTQYDGTQLILPDNNSALFPCPISDSASLGSLTSDKLPGTLPGGDTFVSGVTTSVIKNGASSSPVESQIAVSFTVPDNMKNANLAILYWDGGKWVEVPGHMTPDGHFVATTDLIGTFVLVTK